MKSSFKSCRCGRSYSHEEWEALPDCKEWSIGDITLEQRRCPCGSHIAIQIAGPTLMDDEKDAA